MNIDNSKKKELKSTNNRRCLTSCHPSNETYLHPKLFAEVDDTKHNTCAIDPVYDEINERIEFIDKCRLEDNETYEAPNLLKSMFLGFDMDSRRFLSTLYNINSFDQTIYWTKDNTYMPFETIKRVHNASWRVYGQEITNIVYEYYYYDILINDWWPIYMKKLSLSYTFIEDGTEILVRKGGSNISDRMSGLILNRFFSYNYFYKVMNKYIERYSNKWEEIDSHYDNLKKFCYKSLLLHLSKEQT